MGGYIKNKIVFVTIIFIFFLISSIFTQATVITSNNSSEKFYLWAVSDTHSADYWDDEVSFNGNTWSGSLISENVERIDYALIAGDFTLVGGSAEVHSNYLNDTCSCLLPNRDMSSFWNAPADERIWGFCMGNHEDHIDTLDSAAKGLGLDSSKNWYNNEVVMGNSYNYTVMRGNLMFVYMGGDRRDPGTYSYNLPTPGDFQWLEEKVQWADENNVNVFIVTHTSIFNGTNSYGLPLGHVSHDEYYDIDEQKWKSCTDHKVHICDFDDPWPGDSYKTESDDYKNLIETYQNINLWFSGHTHTANDKRGPPPHKHAGWDSLLGVERDIQKSKYCTYVNTGAIFAWGMPWSYSRILIFTEQSKNVDFKSYDHQAHEYGHDTGWESSHQDITITNCLKYPFDPNFEPTNTAPNKPDIPTGENNGLTGDEYEYSSKTNDLDSDQIYYLFSWGDRSDSGWIGPFDSGETCTVSHTWQDDGAYIVRVKAKDVHGAESKWSESLNVVMPRDKILPKNIFINYLKLILSIVNSFR
jgi:hypothetical protein